MNIVIVFRLFLATSLVEGLPSGGFVGCHFLYENEHTHSLSMYVGMLSLLIQILYI